MRKITLMAAAAGLLALAFGTGCAGFAFSGTNTGFLYANSNRNEGANVNPMGPKRGEACATSILGWITTGDSSAEKAAKDAGITQIATIDNSITNYVGVYAKYCVIVTGQ